MHGQDADLKVCLLLPDPGETGLGSLADLDFRHQLETELDSILRRHKLGYVDGGGTGPGWQDVFMVIDSRTWQQAWEAVQAVLDKKRLLDRVEEVTLSIRGQQPRVLFEASTRRQWTTRARGFLTRLARFRKASWKEAAHDRQ